MSPMRNRNRNIIHLWSQLWWLSMLMLMPWERWETHAVAADSLASAKFNFDSASEGSNSKPKPKPKPKRPNFIVIQPDDHLFFEEWNPPARFYGDDDESVSVAKQQQQQQQQHASLVPNTNRLFQHGLELTNAYSSSTWCGTSRFSTLTGRLPSRSAYGRQQDAFANSYGNMNPNAAHFAASPDAWSGLRNVVIPNTKLEDVPGWGNDCSEDNLAAVLRRHGYATGVVGKWHLGSDDNNNNYNNYYYNDDTYYYYDDDYSWYQDSYLRTQRKVRACGFDFAEAIYKENLDAGNSWTTNKDGGAVTHNMEHVTSEAIKFIEQHAGGSNNNNNNNNDDDDDDTGDDDDEEEEVKPFFLYFNPTVPHHMADVTDALLFSDCKETVGGRLTTPPVIPYGMTANTNPQRPGCQVYRRSVLERAMAAQTAGNPLYKSGHYFHYSDQELLDKLAGAVWIDDAVGSLLETLEANDLLNNTVVLFQLDHGMETKGSLFEGGSRIAQFAHYPDGFGTQRRQLDKPVATIDIAPTLMDLAGILVTQGAVGDDDGDGDGVQQKHYAVDGKSWANDAKALAGNDDDALSSSPSSAVSALDERCLFVEEGLDRSVRCGCYKYIYVSDTMRGNTVRTAETQGMTLRTHNFYNLCDETTGKYRTSPESSPELQWNSNNNWIGQDIRDELKARMECLLAQTDPTQQQLDFETDCGLPLFYNVDQEQNQVEMKEDEVIEEETTDDDDDDALGATDSIDDDGDDDANEDGDADDDGDDADDDDLLSGMGNSTAMMGDSTAIDSSDKSSHVTVSEVPVESPSRYPLPTLDPTAMEIIPTNPPTKPPTITVATTTATEAYANANANVDATTSTSARTNETTSSTTKAVIAVASLLLIITPFFLWWFYKVFIHNPKPETGTILYLAKDHSRVVGMGDNDYHNDYNRVNIHRSHYEKDQLDEHDATDEEKYESSLDYETRTEAPRSTTDEGSVHTASNHSWSSSHCDRSLGTDTDANTSSLLDTMPTNGLEERTPSIGSVESSPSSIWEKLADESKRMAKLREKIHSGDSFREEEHSPEPQQDNNTEGNDHEDDQDRNPSPGPEDIADGTDEASRSGSVSSLSRGSTGSKSSKAGDEDDNNEGTNGGAVAPASGDPKSDGSTSEANADADAEA